MPLAPVPSQAATESIAKAFEELKRTVTYADSQGFDKVTLQSVREASLQIEEQLGARRALRNMKRLTPLFNGLEHYAKAIDILCNGTQYLSWIWAPITVILRVASEYVEAFETIIHGYSRIAESLGRFATLGTAFNSNKEFQQTLAVFYVDILEFHKHAYEFVRRNSWKLLFKTSWGRFQRRFDGLMENLRAHEKLIDQEANAHNIAEARQMRLHLQTWREEQVQKLQQKEEQHSSGQYLKIVSWLKVDESDQISIFETHSSAAQDYPGTCAWITKDTHVRAFLKKERQKPLLWLQGIPGSGKSVLVNQLIKFMDVAGEPTIYHFCSHSFPTSLLYERLILSIIIQILKTDPELVSHVYDRVVVDKRVPSKSMLTELVLEVVTASSQRTSKAGYAWIFIDGIDECMEQQQKEIISVLKLISTKSAQSGGTCYKIFISSRHSKILASMLSRKSVLSLTDRRRDVELSIRQYAGKRLETVQGRLQDIGVSNTDMENIEIRVSQKSDGMFLYAKLVLDYLTNNIFYFASEVRESLEELPDELSDFYQKIIVRMLANLDQRSVRRVKAICGWIAFSKRPLKKHELLAALSYKSKDPYITDLVPAWVLEVTSGLVEERPDGTFAFIHVSLREFLSTRRGSLHIDEGEVLLEHSRTVIGCLLTAANSLVPPGKQDKKSLRVVNGLHGLHMYATQYWAQYLIEYFKFNEVQSHDTALVQLCASLTTSLDALTDRSLEPALDESVSDDVGDLPYLAKYPNLQRLVAAELSRTIPVVHTETQTDTSSSHQSSSKDGIQSLLDHYQIEVYKLLRYQFFPGISKDRFDAFKSAYRSDAHTCRYRSCPHATKGFESEEEKNKHLESHKTTLFCEVSGCLYPSFSSKESLKRHVETKHSTVPLDKPIRKRRAPVFETGNNQTRRTEKRPTETDENLPTNKRSRKMQIKSPGTRHPDNPQSKTKEDNFTTSGEMYSLEMAGVNLGLPEPNSLPESLTAVESFAADDQLVKSVPAVTPHAQNVAPKQPTKPIVDLVPSAALSYNASPIAEDPKEAQRIVQRVMDECSARRNAASRATEAAHAAFWSASEESTNFRSKLERLESEAVKPEAETIARDLDFLENRAQETAKGVREIDELISSVERALETIPIPNVEGKGSPPTRAIEVAYEVVEHVKKIAAHSERLALQSEAIKGRVRSTIVKQFDRARIQRAQFKVRKAVEAIESAKSTGMGSSDSASVFRTLLTEFDAQERSTTPMIKRLLDATNSISEGFRLSDNLIQEVEQDAETLLDLASQATFELGLPANQY